MICCCTFSRVCVNGGEFRLWAISNNNNTTSKKIKFLIKKSIKASIEFLVDFSIVGRVLFQITHIIRLPHPARFNPHTIRWLIYYRHLHTLRIHSNTSFCVSVALLGISAIGLLWIWIAKLYWSVLEVKFHLFFSHLLRSVLAFFVSMFSLDDDDV